jgi:actin-related protein
MPCNRIYHGVYVHGFMCATAQGVDEVAVFADSQRKYATWIGGSIFASLPTFQSLKITAKEWAADEEIVHKKFF